MLNASSDIRLPRPTSENAEDSTIPFTGNEKTDQLVEMANGMLSRQEQKYDQA